MRRKLFFVVASLAMLVFCVHTSAFAITGQKIIMPYVATGTGSWWSGLAILNTTDSPITVNVSARKTDGTSISGKSIAIPAYGMSVDLVERFFTVALPPRVSIYLSQSLGGSTSTFRATLFVGSDIGFGFDDFISESYEWFLPHP